jgi:hypothetical protein
MNKKGLLKDNLFVYLKINQAGSLKVPGHYTGTGEH